MQWVDVAILLTGCAGLVILLIAAVGTMLLVRGRMSRDEIAQLAGLSARLESLEDAVSSMRSRVNREGKTNRPRRADHDDGEPAEAPTPSPGDTRAAQRAAIMARFAGRTNGA